MSGENDENTQLNDEAQLDSEIIDSINRVKAGEALSGNPTGTPASPTETPGADKDEETPSNATGGTGEGTTGTPQADDKGEDGEFRIPNKGKFESDESYEKRVELFDLVKRRKAATTPEAKAELTKQINDAKGELKSLNVKGQKLNSLDRATPSKEGEEDPAVVADRERLKQLGGITKEDLEEILQNDRIIQNTQQTLETFVQRHPQLADEDVRDVFFTFVENNYNWQGKTGKDLMAVLEFARETFFRPSETIQEKVLKAAKVQEKVGVMQFPGGTDSQAGISSEMKQSLEELKATGMSEEKALELLSE